MVHKTVPVRRYVWYRRVADTYSNRELLMQLRRTRAQRQAGLPVDPEYEEALQDEALERVIEGF
jgi:hypothetical protein